MKIKKIILSIVFMSLGLVSMAQEKIEWKDIETAEKEISKKANKDKKYFIDCYTDWCGWCKKMDKDTFSDTLIAKLMNHYFVSAKFDAEQKEDVTVNGKTYKNPQTPTNSKRASVHELAYYLLNNRLSYPSFSILDKDFKVITVVPGYYPAAEFEKVIVYLGEGLMNEVTFETFSKEYAEKYRDKILKKVYSKK